MSELLSELWRRRPAGVLAWCEDQKDRRRDAGATKFLSQNRLRLDRNLGAVGNGLIDLLPEFSGQGLHVGFGEDTAWVGGQIDDLHAACGDSFPAVEGIAQECIISSR